MRDRLIELIKQGDKTFADKYTGKVMSHIDDIYDFIADYLLENGVIVPPCKVGDKVYITIESPEPQIEKKIVESIVIGTVDDKVTFTDGTCFTVWFKEWELFCRAVFLTREKAEQNLKGGGQE